MKRSFLTIVLAILTHLPNGLLHAQDIKIEDRLEVLRAYAANSEDSLVQALESILLRVDGGSLDSLGEAIWSHFEHSPEVKSNLQAYLQQASQVDALVDALICALDPSIEAFYLILNNLKSDDVNLRIQAINAFGVMATLNKYKTSMDQSKSAKRLRSGFGSFALWSCLEESKLKPRILELLCTHEIPCKLFAVLNDQTELKEVRLAAAYALRVMRDNPNLDAWFAQIFDDLADLWRQRNIENHELSILAMIASRSSAVFDSLLQKNLNLEIKISFLQFVSRLERGWADLTNDYDIWIKLRQDLLQHLNDARASDILDIIWEVERKNNRMHFYEDEEFASLIALLERSHSDKISFKAERLLVANDWLSSLDGDLFKRFFQMMKLSKNTDHLRKMLDEISRAYNKRYERIFCDPPEEREIISFLINLQSHANQDICQEAKTCLHLVKNH